MSKEGEELAPKFSDFHERLPSVRSPIQPSETMKRFRNEFRKDGEFRGFLERSSTLDKPPSTR